MTKQIAFSRQTVEVEKLLSYIDKFKSQKVSVLGDIILDEYTWGTVERVSPEAPIVVVQVERENFKLGGAANVAQNLKELGAEVTLFGVIGDDEAGILLSGILEDSGISGAGLVKDKGRPTTRKTRIVAHGQQVVRVDRESQDPICEEIESRLYDCLATSTPGMNSIVISDYKKGVITPLLSKTLLDLNKKGVTGMGKIPVVVDPKGNNYDWYRGASCVKPNRKEAADVSNIKIRNPQDAILAASSIRDAHDFECVMVTLGEMGLVVVEKDKEPFQLDTIAQEVFDVSGAGDTVSAVFSLALAVGASPIEASILANCAAARVIREIGTAAVRANELKEVLEFWVEHQSV